MTDLGDLIAKWRDSIESQTPEEREAEEKRAAERAEVEAKRVAEKARNGRLRVLRDVPIPDATKAAIVDGGIIRTRAIEAVDTWLDETSRPPFLLLLGGVGSGKTVAAAYAMDCATHVSGEHVHGYSAYIKMGRVAELFRAGFGDDRERFEALIAAPSLVVDELSTERDVELGRAALHELVDERGGRGRPTILLANRSKKELASRYDARTIDRLRASMRLVELGQQSMRKGAW